MNTCGQFLHESQVYNGNKVESLNVENASFTYSEHQFFFYWNRTCYFLEV